MVLEYVRLPVNAPFRTREIARESTEPTVASGEGVVPVPVDPVLTGEHRVADQDVAGVALEGDRLPHAVVRVDHVAVLERGRVRAVLQFVG